MLTEISTASVRQRFNSCLWTKPIQSTGYENWILQTKLVGRYLGMFLSVVLFLDPGLQRKLKLTLSQKIRTQHHIRIGDSSNKLSSRTWGLTNWTWHLLW